MFYPDFLSMLLHVKSMIMTGILWPLLKEVEAMGWENGGYQATLKDKNGGKL